MADRCGWDPWAEAARRSHVTIEYAPLGSRCLGAIRRRDGVSVIVLSSLLDECAERFTLTEELIHDERAIGDHILPSPRRGELLNVREERRVHQLALERLVPETAVAAMIAEIRCSGECNLWLWAEDLDIPWRWLLEHLAAIGRRLGPILPWWTTDP